MQSLDNPALSIFQHHANTAGGIYRPFARQIDQGGADFIAARVRNAAGIHRGHDLLRAELDLAKAGAQGIQIGDADLWKALKAGELTGISLAGVARHDPDPKAPTDPAWTEKDGDTPPRWFARLFPALKTTP